MITITVVPAHLARGKKKRVRCGRGENAHTDCQNVTSGQEPIIIKAKMDAK